MVRAAVVTRPRSVAHTLDAMPRPEDRYPPPPAFLDRVGGWRGLLGQPGWVLLPARLFLGGTFLFAGLQKLADPNFLDAGHPTSIQSQLASFRAASPIGSLLGPVADHAVAFGVLIAVAEVAVGLGMLLGLWARVAAFGGLLLSTLFFLTVSWGTRPYYYGSDIFVMVMWLPYLAVGAAGVLSLDAALRRRAARDLAVDPTAPPPERRRELDRRTLVRGAAAAGVVAAGGVALAGADAAIGRALVGNGSTATAEPSSTPSRPAAGGTTVATVSQVPVGGARTFQNPATGNPAIAVQPTAGDVKAFSAICSHAGCIVSFDQPTHRFRCPCHNSMFDGATGRVLNGPAPRGLDVIPVTVEGGEIKVEG